MEFSYFITNEKESIHLFKLPFEYKCEEPAIYDFTYKFEGKRDLTAEDIIRELYGTLLGGQALGSSPIELLKILLANGFDLKYRKGDREFKLIKNTFQSHMKLDQMGRSSELAIFIGPLP
ncbi:MAG: hypothetical protein AB7H97_06290 [Pseudobdellovibrionaceae bacterium]